MSESIVAWGAGAMLPDELDGQFSTTGLAVKGQHTRSVALQPLHCPIWI